LALRAIHDVIINGYVSLNWLNLRVLFDSKGSIFKVKLLDLNLYFKRFVGSCSHLIKYVLSP
jgi:hypothetical protein